MYNDGASTERRKITRSTRLVCACLFFVLCSCVLSSACYYKKITTLTGNYLVMIDPGHGGEDLGDVASIEKVTEKEINLMRAKRIADYINKNPNFSAELTRDNDESAILEKRTAFANTKNADIFISLHTNFSQDLNDVELYSIGLIYDKKTINLTAKENLTTAKNINDLNLILEELIKKSAERESSQFADALKKGIVANTKACGNSKIKSIRAKKAPFYVLLGATMPAVLIETPYWADTVTGQNTTDDWDCFCEGLMKGIISYLLSTESV